MASPGGFITPGDHRVLTIVLLVEPAEALVGPSRRRSTTWAHGSVDGSGCMSSLTPLCSGRSSSHQSIFREADYLRFWAISPPMNNSGAAGMAPLPGEQAAQVRAKRCQRFPPLALAYRAIPCRAYHLVMASAHRPLCHGRRPWKVSSPWWCDRVQRVVGEISARIHPGSTCGRTRGLPTPPGGHPLLRRSIFGLTITAPGRRSDPHRLASPRRTDRLQVLTPPVLVGHPTPPARGESNKTSRRRRRRAARRPGQLLQPAQRALWPPGSSALRYAPWLNTNVPQSGVRAATRIGRAPTARCPSKRASAKVVAGEVRGDRVDEHAEPAVVAHARPSDGEGVIRCPDVRRGRSTR